MPRKPTPIDVEQQPIPLAHVKFTGALNIGGFQTTHFAAKEGWEVLLWPTAIVSISHAEHGTHYAAPGAWVSAERAELPRPSKTLTAAIEPTVDTPVMHVTADGKVEQLPPADNTPIYRGRGVAFAETKPQTKLAPTLDPSKQ